MSAPDEELPPQATVAARLSTYLRGGGIVTPLITVVFAFLVGGLVVLLTGHDPIATYKAIFDGTGLNWIFPWTSADERTVAAINLQQTLIQTTPLILTGLAVAFAFPAACSTSAARASTWWARTSPCGSARCSRTWRGSRTSCWRSWSERSAAPSGRRSPVR